MIEARSADAPWHTPSVVEQAEHERMGAAVDAEVVAALATALTTVTSLDPRAAEMVTELERIHAAGGGRLRGVLTWWGHRAGGGADGPPVVRAGAAIELLHLMAIIHDDVMDDAAARRGVASVHASFAERVPSPALARSLAVLTGDLAAVLADRTLDGAGFSPERLAAGRARYDEMRVAMATGQFLDLTTEEGTSSVVAALKGGSYSIEGPLVIGAVLAGADGSVVAALGAYGRPLGVAFQARDDVRDGDSVVGDIDVAALRAEAVAALKGVPGPVAEALTALAREVTTT